MKNIKHPYGNKKSFFLKTVKSFIQKLVKFFVNFFCKLDLYDEIIISSATHAPWKKDKKFLNFYSKISEFTLLDFPRAYTLWQCSKNLKDVEGLILDIGCLLGGSGFLMSKINNKNKTYLFDSFSGFKKDDGLHKKETFFYEDIDFVKKNIIKLKLKNTKVFKAFFPKNLKVNIKKIKLCHIDVNTFYDTKKIFNWIDKKVIKGGIIVFDDFGIWGVDGIKKFIYSIEKKQSKKYHFIKNYMGQCILIKK
tara:strand:+ start:5461 stop:6210 length:750 start_codon:yes stop_codon:yes gene_type:complete